MSQQSESRLLGDLADGSQDEDSLLKSIIPGQLSPHFSTQIRTLGDELLPNAIGLPSHNDAFEAVTGVAGLLIGKFYRDQTGEKSRKALYQKSIDRVREEAANLFQARDLQKELRSFLVRGLARSILLILSEHADISHEELQQQLFGKTDGDARVAFKLTAGFIGCSAVRLIGDLHLRRATVADLRGFLHFHKLTARRTTYATRQGGYGTVGSSLLAQTVRKVLISNASFTRLAETAFPVARSENWLLELKPRSLDGQYGIDPIQKEELAAKMWELAKDTSDLTNDVFDILTQVYVTQAPGAEGTAVIHVDDILKLRDVKAKLGGSGRRGGYTPQQREEIRSALERIANLSVQPTSPGPQRSAQPSRLFELFGDDLNQPLGTLQGIESFAFRPADALLESLTGERRQTALLAAKALEYNSRTQVYEKRLIRYLSWMWRIRARADSYTQPYRVSTVLEAINLVPSETDPGKNPCPPRESFQLSTE